MRSRDEAEDNVRAAAEGATRSILKRTLAAAKAAIASGRFGDTQPVVALGTLLGWWTEAVDDKVVGTIQDAWRAAHSVTLEGKTVTTARSDAMAFHISAVVDRLSRRAVPEIPQAAFDQVRLSQSAAALGGWGTKEAARDIAERLAWEPDKTYWKQVKADAEAAIDALLDPLGKPGTPARTYAHKNDPTVKFWQSVRADAVDKINEDRGDWETRSLRIARTEATAAWNSGALAALASEGRTYKRWLAHIDARTRDSHREADGQVQPMSQPFRVGTSLLMMPGDPSGPPHEVIQCRCTVVGADAPAPKAVTAGGGVDETEALVAWALTAAAGGLHWKDEVRIPKGNGNKSGQWTFTPWKHLDQLDSWLAIQQATFPPGTPAGDALAKEVAPRLAVAHSILDPLDTDSFNPNDPQVAIATKAAGDLITEAGDKSPLGVLGLHKAGADVKDFGGYDWSLFSEKTDIGANDPDWDEPADGGEGDAAEPPMTEDELAQLLDDLTGQSAPAAVPDPAAPAGTGEDPVVAENWEDALISTEGLTGESTPGAGAHPPLADPTPTPTPQNPTPPPGKTTTKAAEALQPGDVTVIHNTPVTVSKVTVSEDPYNPGSGDMFASIETDKGTYVLTADAEVDVTTGTLAEKTFADVKAGDVIYVYGEPETVSDVSQYPDPWGSSATEVLIKTESGLAQTGFSDKPVHWLGSVSEEPVSPPDGPTTKAVKDLQPGDVFENAYGTVAEVKTVEPSDNPALTKIVSTEGKTSFIPNDKVVTLVAPKTTLVDIEVPTTGANIKVGDRLVLEGAVLKKATGGKLVAATGSSPTVASVKVGPKWANVTTTTGQKLWVGVGDSLTVHRQGQPTTVGMPAEAVAAGDALVEIPPTSIVPNDVLKLTGPVLKKSAGKLVPALPGQQGKHDDAPTVAAVKVGPKWAEVTTTTGQKLWIPSGEKVVVDRTPGLAVPGAQKVGAESWKGKPWPVPPEEPVLPEPGKPGPHAFDAWLQKVKDRYDANPNKAKATLEQSNNWSSVQQATSGDPAVAKSAIESLHSNKYLDDALRDEALQIYADAAVVPPGAMEKYQADHAAWEAEMALHAEKAKAWQAANPTTLKGMSGAKTFSNNHEGVEWANKNLTPVPAKSKSVIKEMKSSSHWMNSHLWQGGPVPDHLKAKVALLDAAMSPIPTDLYLFRGTNLSEFKGVSSIEKLKKSVGTTFVQHAYQPTGLGVDTHFSGSPIQIVYRAPAGTKGAWALPVSPPPFTHEREFMLARNTRYFIHSVVQKNGKTFVEAEIIPEGHPDPTGQPPMSLTHKVGTYFARVRPTGARGTIVLSREKAHHGGGADTATGRRAVARGQRAGGLPGAEPRAGDALGAGDPGEGASWRPRLQPGRARLDPGRHGGRAGAGERSRGAGVPAGQPGPGDAGRGRPRGNPVGVRRGPDGDLGGLRPGGQPDRVTAGAGDDYSDSVCIMAIPAAGDPVHDIGPEDKHATVLYFGDISDHDDPEAMAATKEPMLGMLLGVGQDMGPFSAKVIGVEPLGDSEPPAQVWMLDSPDLQALFLALREATPDAIYDGADATRYPEYTPHVTIGYGVDDDDLAEAAGLRAIAFDRLSLWWGDEHIDVPLVGPPLGYNQDEDTGGSEP